MAFDIFRHVTDSILAQMERGVAPWRRPWSKDSTVNGAMPLNHKKIPYRGINTLILWSQSSAMGYASNVWMTFNQAKKYGGSVKKGEKGTGIVFWSVSKKVDSNNEEKTWGFLKTYWVFNVDQIENLPSGKFDTVKPLPVTAEEVKTRDKNCENFAKKIGIDYSENKGNRAYYMPSVDKVTMPLFAKFESPESYYSVLWHEFSHATGHEKRLDRKLSGSFGSADYAFEELVAEMSAAFLCAITGVSLEPRKDHADYLGSWIKGLKDDKKAIFKAASLAAKSANWLLDAGGIDYSEELEAE